MKFAFVFVFFPRLKVVRINGKFRAKDFPIFSTLFPGFFDGQSGSPGNYVEVETYVKNIFYCLPGCTIFFAMHWTGNRLFFKDDLMFNVHFDPQFSWLFSFWAHDDGSRFRDKHVVADT